MAILYHTCTHLKLSYCRCIMDTLYLDSINQFKADMYLNTLIISNIMVHNQTKYFICTISVQPSFHSRTKKYSDDKINCISHYKYTSII